MTLIDFFALHPKAALAFSGGVDSAYLYAAAKACGADIKSYFVNTAFVGCKAVLYVTCFCGAGRNEANAYFIVGKLGVIFLCSLFCETCSYLHRRQHMNNVFIKRRVTK